MNQVHDELPPPPPLPPPKIISDFLQDGLTLPLTPTIPTTPTSPLPPDTRSKRPNPLTDLIETEKSYVDQLTGIIRKVAAAWSRSNLPPPDLDTMFRSVEGVYKANRSLLLKLKEIGANPKALGDLLMRWIDDLEGPYTIYCARFCGGFDTWDPVQANPRLATVLANFSVSNPPSSSAHPIGSSEPPKWTLDTLFLLPKTRLKYYKRLYNRLLKSATPGRSDHRLLVGALEKLDRLLSTLESREMFQPGSTESAKVTPPVETEDEVVIDLRNHVEHENWESRVGKTQVDPTPSNEGSSTRRSSMSSSQGSLATLSMPISDLERRLATQHTLDIFTMKPKVVRLQMAPPYLLYTRELRLSADVVIHLTPRSTGIEVIHRQGHIFLLSDLFLVCERMTLEEKEQGGPDGPDMWLCYPPLAGKVLRVSEVSGQDNALHVSVMRKENLILLTESVEARNFMLSEFKECIDFAGKAPVSNQLPPPMPPLDGIISQSSSSSIPSDFPRALTQLPSTITATSQGSSPSHQTGPNEPPPTTDRSLPIKSSSNEEISSSLVFQRVPPPRDNLLSPNAVRTSPSTPASSGSSLSNIQPPSRIASLETGPPRDPNFEPGGNHHSPMDHHLMGNYLNQSFSSQGHYGHPPPIGMPGGAPSDPSFQGGIRKSPSTRSIASQYERSGTAPPIPSFPGGYPPQPHHNFIPRNNSYGSLHTPQPRPLLPSSQYNPRSVSIAERSFIEPSPPNSPVEETPPPPGPITSTISAQMKCKVFLKQHHAQWKSFGSAKLKLYHQDPTNIKQLVVEADNKERSILISTIVLTDGVERVGKTGVAIELSDKGARTGIVYMIQLRSDKVANGLFESLLAGSDRATRN